jgi:hypothetical protein
MLVLVKMRSNVQELTGIGEEVLTDSEGNVRAWFVDGNFRQSPLKIPPNREEPTLYPVS